MVGGPGVSVPRAASFSTATSRSMSRRSCGRATSSDHCPPTSRTTPRSWTASTRISLDGTLRRSSAGSSPIISDWEFFTGTRSPTDDGRRGLATVLFTDIVGSTARAGELGDEAWKVLVGARTHSCRCVDRLGLSRCGTTADEVASVWRLSSPPPPKTSYWNVPLSLVRTISMA